MNKKYTVGQILDNGLVILDGPFKSNTARNVKYLIQCPRCKESTLKYGNTLSKLKFGCLKCYAESLKRFDQKPAVSKAYRSLKSNAKFRGIVVEISLDDFYSIASQNCFWCGIPPLNKTGLKEWHADVCLSGIDRKNNDQGYTLDNSVACCYDCNRAKSDLPVDLWKYWIVRIVNNNKEWVEKESSLTHF